MLPKKNRLSSKEDFRRVFVGGKTYSHRLLILKVLMKGGESDARFAFSASSKLRKSVIRNRSKRLLREAVRLLGNRLRMSGYDAVLIARPPIRESNFSEVSLAVCEVFQKAGLLKLEEDRQYLHKTNKCEEY
ncbi:MAG: ribonuclease P protein component [Armatimonadota bacterium]